MTLKFKKMGNLIGTKKAGEKLGYTSAYIRQLCGDKIIREFLQARKIGRDWMFIPEKINEIVEDKNESEKITKYIKRKRPTIKNFKVSDNDK